MVGVVNGTQQVNGWLSRKLGIKIILRNVLVGKFAIRLHNQPLSPQQMMKSNRANPGAVIRNAILQLMRSKYLTNPTIQWRGKSSKHPVPGNAGTRKGRMVSVTQILSFPGWGLIAEPSGIARRRAQRARPAIN
jgi:hypothetical protein